MIFAKKLEDYRNSNDFKLNYDEAKEEINDAVIKETKKEYQRVNKHATKLGGAILGAGIGLGAIAVALPAASVAVTLGAMTGVGIIASRLLEKLAENSYVKTNKVSVLESNKYKTDSSMWNVFDSVKLDMEDTSNKLKSKKLKV